MLRHRLYRTLEPVSPDFDTDCLSCAQKGQYASMWNILALANLLKVKVTIIYPAVNGSETYSFKALNQKIKPPFVDPQKPTITIMWTSTRPPPRNGLGKQTGVRWEPNHFVPLVNSNRPMEKIELPEVTGDFKDVSNTAANPVNIVDNHKEVSMSVRKGSRQTSPGVQHSDCGQKSKSLTRSMEPKPISSRNTSTVAAVRKGSHMTSPGVQHSDADHDDIISKQQSLSCQVSQQNLSCHDTPSFNREMDDVDVKSEQQGSFHLEFDDVDTNSKQESFNLEFDDVDTNSKQQNPSCQESQQNVSCQHDNTDADTSLMETGVISLPDLSTIEEEPSVLHDESPVMQTLRDPSPSQKTAKSPEYNTEDSSLVSDLDESLTEEFKPGPLKKYLEIDELLNILEGPNFPLKEIPVGRKDGMYFILDDSMNIERRKDKKQSQYWDDSGVWGHSSSPPTPFVLENGKWTSLRLRSGIYCKLRYKNKQEQYIPIDPQPNPDDVLTVHRLYQKLQEPSSKDKNKFKRRVTWIEKSESTLQGIPPAIAIVEYIGTYPGRGFHGNVKDEERNAPFVRTKPHVMQKLKSELKHRSVKDVERQLNRETPDDFEKHKNEKQLRNAKYNIANDKNNRGMSNIADQIICVEEMTKTHEFVQSVKHLSGMNHPVITLFTEQQINDVKRFCCRDDAGVLGMDKTYNLGEFHVTPTVYKDKSVKRREGSQDHPICFGPTFIHQSSTTKAYQSFLHDIADNLTDNEIANLTVGTDEELAFKNAIKRCFSGSTHVLCTRHLKENTNRHMQNQIGYPESDRIEINNAIFGKNGIIGKTDVDTFEYRLSAIRRSIEENDKKVGDKRFMPYFENKLLPLLQQHVIEPVKNGKVGTAWTNNNCESANHVLKTATNWKIQDMPSFIDKLYNIVKGDEEDRCRAIRQTGSYRLDQKFKHHEMDVSQWATLSEEVQHKRIKRFMTDMGKANSNIVVSTDGSRTAQKTPSAGRKPGQRKRKCAERSRTPTAKRRLTVSESDAN